MALKDIALKYLAGILTTSDPVAISNTLTVTDGGTTGTNCISALSAQATTSAGYFKQLPPGGSASTHALTAYQAGTSGVGSALNATSDNPSASAVQVSGSDTATGTVKITHAKPAGSDANAAGLSIDLTGASTAAQGIFITSSTGTTTGNLIELKNNGRDDFVVKGTGRVGVGVATGATPAGLLALQQNDDTTKGLVVQANSAASLALLEARNSSGTPVCTVSPAGDLAIVNVAATGNAQGTATPANHNLIAWSWDPTLCSNNQIATNGTVYLIKMYVPVAVSATKVYWHVATAGVTATAGQNEVGLYSSTGTKLASANVDADITSTGLKATTITSQLLLAGSTYWVGLVFNAGTAPNLARATGLSGASGLINAGLIAANYRFVINGTAQTVLPSSITPGSNTQGVSWWAAVGP